MNCRKQQGRNARRRQRPSAVPMTLEERRKAVETAKRSRWLLVWRKPSPQAGSQGRGDHPQWSRERPGFGSAPYFLIFSKLDLFQ